MSVIGKWSLFKLKKLWNNLEISISWSTMQEWSKVKHSQNWTKSSQARLWLSTLNPTCGYVRKWLVLWWKGIQATLLQSHLSLDWQEPQGWLTIAPLNSRHTGSMKLWELKWNNRIKISSSLRFAHFISTQVFLKEYSAPCCTNWWIQDSLPDAQLRPFYKMRQKLVFHGLWGPWLTFAKAFSQLTQLILSAISYWDSNQSSDMENSKADKAKTMLWFTQNPMRNDLILFLSNL